MSLSALWMYGYAVYAILDGVEAGTLFLFHYLKKFMLFKVSCEHETLSVNMAFYILVFPSNLASSRELCTFKSLSWIHAIF